MKVWIVREACFTSEASARAYAGWNPGATVRLVDIAALERVAEAAREMVAAERGVAESFRADPRSGGIGAAGWKAAKNAVRDAIDALDVARGEEG